jgi:hypothetical protein
MGASIRMQSLAIAEVFVVDTLRQEVEISTVDPLGDLLGDQKETNYYGVCNTCYTLKGDEFKANGGYLTLDGAGTQGLDSKSTKGADMSDTRLRNNPFEAHKDKETGDTATDPKTTVGSDLKGTKDSSNGVSTAALRRLRDYVGTDPNLQELIRQECQKAFENVDHTFCNIDLCNITLQDESSPTSGKCVQGASDPSNPNAGPQIKPNSFSAEIVMTGSGSSKKPVIKCQYSAELCACNVKRP